MKILIIEDEPELIERIVTYLKEENYVCELAGDFNGRQHAEKCQCSIYYKKDLK